MLPAPEPALARAELDLLLLDAARAAAASVLQPWRVAARSGSTLHLKRRGQSRSLTARVIVAANGSWSGDPFQLQASPVHGERDMLAFKSHFRDVRLSESLLPLLTFPGGYGGTAQVAGGVVSLSFCVRRSALRAFRRAFPGLSAGEAVFSAASDAVETLREAFAVARRESPWIAVGPIRPHTPGGFVDGVFRVGNAAGEPHAVIADGITMAMQSAHLLAHHLARAGADGNLRHAGERYAQAWRRTFRPRLAAAACFAELAIRPAAMAGSIALLRRYPQGLVLAARLGGKGAAA